MGETAVPRKPIHALIIHPGREPGVIDNGMITRCILEYGPTEEAGRLFAEEGVHLDEASVLRLEFQNILRLDHLWMLTSLTKLTLAHNLIEKIENLESLTGLNELDLSFNKIEKIENLETLVNLEILTLFHNQIKKLENMDTLEKLLVFSIGDNLIEDYKEMVYLRRFRHLRSVSFKGNPCCDDPNTNKFLKSALGRVTYLDYQIIKDSDREPGRALFRGVLRLLDEADEKTEAQRLAKEQYDNQVVFYAMSFVEYLSGPELLITMFEKDPDGTVLLSFGSELIPLFDEYKEEYVANMTELVDFALEAYHDREAEIKLFRGLVDNALEDSIKTSKKALEEYEVKKQPLVKELNALVSNVTTKQATLEDIEQNIIDVGDMFNEVVYDLWKNLMMIEMRLFEQCEESRVQFAVNMTDKINRLLEASRSAFGLWREQDGQWSSKQFEVLTKYLGNKIMLADASPELFEAMTDRDMLMSSIASSMDNHSRFIDTREDLLMSRANAWRDDLVAGTTNNEIKRNRDRITEINYFIDNQRMEWADLQLGLNETIDPETAALLGDDF